MIFDKLVDIIAAQFDVPKDDITMETNFVEDLEANSIDVVALMMDIEDAFDLEEIDNDVLESIRTVGDVVKLITDHNENK